MASTSLLPFLRPLPLPRSSSLQRLQRPPQTTLPPPRLCPLIQQRTAAAFANYIGRQTFPGQTTPVSRRRKKAHPSNRPKRHPSPSKILVTPPTPDPAAIESLPYYVHRTPSKQLPIYKLAKRGGNLKQTRLRKINGDVSALRRDLMEAMKLEEKECRINQLTGHILIKVGSVV
ncbi:MAG: hypothetical protein Q9191_007075 [Dirinaria sp. TL-2023a]